MLLLPCACLLACNSPSGSSVKAPYVPHQRYLGASEVNTMCVPSQHTHRTCVPSAVALLGSLRKCRRAENSASVVTCMHRLCKGFKEGKEWQGMGGGMGGPSGEATRGRWVEVMSLGAGARVGGETGVI